MTPELTLQIFGLIATFIEYKTFSLKTFEDLTSIIKRKRIIALISVVLILYPSQISNMVSVIYLYILLWNLAVRGMEVRIADACYIIGLNIFCDNEEKKIKYVTDLAKLMLEYYPSNIPFVKNAIGYLEESYIYTDLNKKEHQREKFHLYKYLSMITLCCENKNLINSSWFNNSTDENVDDTVNNPCMELINELNRVSDNFLAEIKEINEDNNAPVIVESKSKKKKKSQDVKWSNILLLDSTNISKNKTVPVSKSYSSKLCSSILDNKNNEKKKSIFVKERYKEPDEYYVEEEPEVKSSWLTPADKMLIGATVASGIFSIGNRLSNMAEDHGTIRRTNLNDEEREQLNRDAYYKKEMMEQKRLDEERHREEQRRREREDQERRNREREEQSRRNMEEVKNRMEENRRKEEEQRRRREEEAQRTIKENYRRREEEARNRNKK